MHGKNQPPHKAPEPTEETLTVKEHQRKRKPKRTAEELTASLPVKEVVLDLDENQRSCGTCGHPLKRIGKKYLYEELEIIPRQVHVIKYYSATYACENCEKESGYAHIYSLAAPPRLLKHSLASASTVADVMAKKYVDGLPLYRQEKIWVREGVALSRATMANWVIQTAQTWLKPLYRRLKKHLLESQVIYADETVVQVLKEDGKPATSESRMWVYGSEERGGNLDPQAYLLLLLKQLPFMGRNPSQDDLDLLLPWRPAVQAECTSSMHEISSEDL